MINVSDSVAAASCSRSQIATDVLEHHHGAVGFEARLFTKMNAIGQHPLVIAPEVVCLEEQEDPDRPLATDGGRCSSLATRASSSAEPGALGATRTQRLPGLPGSSGVSSNSSKPIPRVKKVMASS